MPNQNKPNLPGRLVNKEPFNITLYIELQVMKDGRIEAVTSRPDGLSVNLLRKCECLNIKALMEAGFQQAFTLSHTRFQS